jgi:hypothetical protein
MHAVRDHGSAALLASIGLCAALLTAACGPDETSGTGGQASSSSTATSVSSATSTGTQSAGSCAQDPRVVAYAAGVVATATDGALSVHFMAADPAPPAKGNNTWTVRVLDGKGDPVNGAAIVTKAFMPDHGHGSSIKPQATGKGDDGTYEITPVNLFMPGVWQITFTVTPAGGKAESAIVNFCVEG